MTKDNNPVAVGWNGAPAGMPHCAGNDCPGVIPGNCGTLHAEVNALKKAEALLPRAPGVDLYTTHSPCIDCTRFIIEPAGVYVLRLFFEIPYRNTQHLGMLEGKTEVYELTPAGYIVDYFTRQVMELP